MNTLNREFITAKMKANRFNFDLKKRPVIVVLRETDKNLQLVKDNGENICDTIILMDEKNFIPLAGRSFAHKKYQKAFLEGGEGCNKIASSYVIKAWRKGTHKKYRALQQNTSFYLWRSMKDMSWNNDDDKVYNQIVGDNFHALAPWSAGCVTVQGYPEQPEKYPGGIRGDWKVADNYLYNTKKDFTFFDACILEHKDVSMDYPVALRLGSTGPDVSKLQQLLGLQKTDGDFGPVTFEALRVWQKENDIFADGIAWPEVLSKLGFSDLSIKWGDSVIFDAYNVFKNVVKPV